MRQVCCYSVNLPLLSMGLLLLSDLLQGFIWKTFMVISILPWDASKWKTFMTEALYKKLYYKYSRLKIQKFTEVDRANDELEQVFVEYASAADGFVEQLKLENEKLRASVHDLRKETAILRSTKDQQYDCFQKSYLEEKQKNRQLSAEITRLQKLQECSSGGIITHSEQEGDAYQHTPVHLEDQSTQSGTQITGN